MQCQNANEQKLARRRFEGGHQIDAGVLVWSELSMG